MNKSNKYFFDRFDLSVNISNSLQRALTAEFGHNSDETIKQVYRCAKKFILFLIESQLNKKNVLPESVVEDFHDWLLKSHLGGSTRQSIQNVVLTLLKWCLRNETGILLEKTNFNIGSFVREKSKKRNIINEADVKKILDICYKKIELVEKRILFGRKILSTKDEREKNDLWQLIIDLLSIGEGLFPKQSEIQGVIGLRIHQRIEENGGLRLLKSKIYLMQEDIFYFYLVLIIQTAGNPYALRDLSIDCISRHPIRDDLEYINWGKRRAAVEQRVDFPLDKEWSAPNIIRRLMVLNEPLRNKTSINNKMKLLIALGGNSMLPRVPSIQSLHNYLSEFIKENNLNNFDYKDFRKAAAKMHLIAGGGIDSARQKLNHGSVETTARNYIDKNDFAVENDNAIIKYQGLLIKKSKLISGTDLNDLKQKTSKIGEGKSETVFGFSCLDPYAGIDKYSAKGSLCMNFNHCSTCSGAIITVDDPQVIGRILSTYHALIDAKDRASKNGWDVRFSKLYASTLQIIEKEVLPFVDIEVMKIAQKYIDKNRIPFLE